MTITRLESGPPESLADVLRAEVNCADIEMVADEPTLLVLAQREDGTRYIIGRVATELFARDRALGRQAVSRIKFAPFRERDAQPARCGGSEA